MGVFFRTGGGREAGRAALRWQRDGREAASGAGRQRQPLGGGGDDQSLVAPVSFNS